MKIFTLVTEGKTGGWTDGRMDEPTTWGFDGHTMAKAQNNQSFQITFISTLEDHHTHIDICLDFILKHTQSNTIQIIAMIYFKRMDDTVQNTTGPTNGFV